MKNWAVTDIRWANTNDLSLPFWQKWNKQNPLPANFWQRIWEYPYAASHIPSSDKVLDVGGTYPFVLFKNFPKAISVDCRDLNCLDHPFHLGKWPQGSLIISDAANIPTEDNSFDHVFSISAIEEMPHTFEVLKEMIRVAKHRVVVTMDISDSLGMPVWKLRELEEFLNCKIPSLPVDSLTSTANILSRHGQSKAPKYKDIRVLGFTIDSRDTPKSVAILIPHYNSWHFLKPCIEYIKENKNSDLKERIYVLDDASNDGSFEKARKQFEDKDTEFHRLKRSNKSYGPDIGLILDEGLRFVKEQYTAMIDADLFPISKHWLSFPIWLLEHYNCSSVGLDTGLSEAYLKRIKTQQWWQPDNGYMQYAALYDNEYFTCTNNLYRIMPTALAKVVSENIGFSSEGIRPGNVKRYANFILKLPPRFRTIAEKIQRKAAHHQDFIYNKRHPYFPGGEDNGVAANHFIDINRMGPKFNIPLTSYIGLTPKDGAFAQNISGLAFHFALSSRLLASEKDRSFVGSVCETWLKKIEEAKGLNGHLLKEMIEASTEFKPGRYDGSIPVSWYKGEYAYIQKLLAKYEREK